MFLMKLDMEFLILSQCQSINYYIYRLGAVVRILRGNVRFNYFCINLIARTSFSGCCPLDGRNGRCRARGVKVRIARNVIMQILFRFPHT